jgi:hypothetical protein
MPCKIALSSVWRDTSEPSGPARRDHLHISMLAKRAALSVYSLLRVSKRRPLHATASQLNDTLRSNERLSKTAKGRFGALEDLDILGAGPQNTQRVTIDGLWQWRLLRWESYVTFNTARATSDDLVRETLILSCLIGDSNRTELVYNQWTSCSGFGKSMNRDSCTWELAWWPSENSLTISTFVRALMYHKGNVVPTFCDNVERFKHEWYSPCSLNHAKADNTSAWVVYPWTRGSLEGTCLPLVLAVETTSMPCSTIFGRSFYLLSCFLFHWLFVLVMSAYFSWAAAFLFGSQN